MSYKPITQILKELAALANFFFFLKMKSQNLTIETSKISELFMKKEAKSTLTLSLKGSFQRTSSCDKFLNIPRNLRRRLTCGPTHWAWIITIITTANKQTHKHTHEQMQTTWPDTYSHEHITTHSHLPTHVHKHTKPTHVHMARHTHACMHAHSTHMYRYIHIHRHILTQSIVVNASYHSNHSILPANLWGKHYY